MTTDPADLAVAYALAVDRRDAPALAKLFTRDARIHLPAGMTGADAPETSVGPDGLLAPLERWARTRHVVMQQRIEVAADGASARGECYSEAHHVAVKDGSAHDLVLHLRYFDDFVCTADDWRFAARRLLVDWSSRQSVRLWD
jgi:hypothetical protein